MNYALLLGMSPRSLRTLSPVLATHGYRPLEADSVDEFMSGLDLNPKMVIVGGDFARSTARLARGRMGSATTIVSVLDERELGGPGVEDEILITPLRRLETEARFERLHQTPAADPRLTRLALAVARLHAHAGLLHDADLGDLRRASEDVQEALGTLLRNAMGMDDGDSPACCLAGLPEAQAR